MEGEGEVGDQFRALNENEHSYYSVQCVRNSSFVMLSEQNL